MAFAPKRSELVEKFCARPPPKELLIHEINNILNRNGNKLGDTSKYMPDKEFLLFSLSTLNPDHDIFKRSYVPPPRK